MFYNHTTREYSQHCFRYNLSNYSGDSDQHRPYTFLFCYSGNELGGEDPHAVERFLKDKVGYAVYETYGLYFVFSKFEQVGMSIDVSLFSSNQNS